MGCWVFRLPRSRLCRMAGGAKKGRADPVRAAKFGRLARPTAVGFSAAPGLCGKMGPRFRHCTDPTRLQRRTRVAHAPLKHEFAVNNEKTSQMLITFSRFGKTFQYEMSSLRPCAGPQQRNSVNRLRGLYVREPISNDRLGVFALSMGGATGYSPGAEVFLQSAGLELWTGVTDQAS